VTYDETLAYLLGLEAVRGWDLKLERVRSALERLGSPERTVPSLLIAGTNGKGSTAALCHASLRASGRRVGLYTSPHLVRFTERIRVDESEIEPGEVVAGVARIRRLVPPEESGLTFFEVATLLALGTFAAHAVDVAVLEVGLGGRLDATNVVEPVVSAIVSVGFDHQDYLGTSLAQIAREKAGVMRPGRAVVLGPAIPAEARIALIAEADRIGARLVPAESVVPHVPPVALRGAHMRRNAAVARAVLEELGAAAPSLRLDDDAIRSGFARVRWPGRLGVIRRSPLVICDAAHNPDGAAALAAALPELVGGEKVRLIFGALRDKDWQEMARVLTPLAREVAVVPVESPRSVAPADLGAAFAGPPVILGASAGAALAEMLRSDRRAPIVVTGSIFLIGEVYADLLGAPSGASVFSAPWEEE
jgi:dihydrofolate synthase/folylpolyglutamate synthase